MAARSVKTPTAAAEFILNLSLSALNTLTSLENRFSNAVTTRMVNENAKIGNLSLSIASSVNGFLVRKESMLAEYYRLLPRLSSAYFDNILSKLNVLETKVNLLNPMNLLQKGYTLTSQGGKIITSVSQIVENIPMKSTFFDGEVISTPIHVDKHIQ